MTNPRAIPAATVRDLIDHDEQKLAAVVEDSAFSEGNSIEISKLNSRRDRARLWLSRFIPVVVRTYSRVPVSAGAPGQPSRLVGWITSEHLFRVYRGVTEPLHTRVINAEDRHHAGLFNRG